MMQWLTEPLNDCEREGIENAFEPLVKKWRTVTGCGSDETRCRIENNNPSCEKGEGAPEIVDSGTKVGGSEKGKRSTPPPCVLRAGNSGVAKGEKGSFTTQRIEANTLIKRFSATEENVISWEECLSCKALKREWDLSADKNLSAMKDCICSDIDAKDRPANINGAIIETFCCTFCDVIHQNSPNQLQLTNTLTIESDPMNKRSSLVVLDKYCYDPDGKVVFQRDRKITPWNEKLRLINEAPRGRKGNCALVYWQCNRKPARSTLAVISTTTIEKNSELLFDSYGWNYERCGYEWNENTEEYRLVENMFVKNTYGQLFAHGIGESDTGKSISIQNGMVTINGTRRPMRWDGAQYQDCAGTIDQVQCGRRGKVALTCGQSFENGESDVGKHVGVRGSCITIGADKYYVKWSDNPAAFSGRVMSVTETGVQLRNEINGQTQWIPNPCDSISEPKRLYGWERSAEIENNAFNAHVTRARKDGFKIDKIRSTALKSTARQLRIIRSLTRRQTKIEKPSSRQRLSG